MIGRQIIRNITTSAMRRSGDHHSPGGIPGENLPFPIHNRYMLTGIFIVFMGSAFGLPFFMMRHQLMK